jgi:hypothetical protein
VNVVGEELEGSEPLSVHPLDMGAEQGVPNLVSSNWVAQRVKNLCHLVGLSCDGFRIKCWRYFLRLKLEEVRLASYVSEVCFKAGTKGNQELKRLDSSINYDKNKG